MDVKWLVAAVLFLGAAIIEFVDGTVYTAIVELLLAIVFGYAGVKGKGN